VEKTFSRSQPQFPADVFKLLLLGNIQRVVAATEIGAGINAPLVQPETEEVVVDVVMLADRAAIIKPRVAKPAAYVKTPALRLTCLTTQGLAHADRFARIPVNVKILLDIVAREFAHARIDQCSQYPWRAQRQH